MDKHTEHLVAFALMSSKLDAKELTLEEFFQYMKQYEPDVLELEANEAWAFFAEKVDSYKDSIKAKVDTMKLAEKGRNPILEAYVPRTVA